MVWDTDYDVKEYHPRRKRASAANASTGIMLPISVAPEEKAALVRDGFLVENSSDRMSISEILDFSAGTDSYAY